MFETLYRKYRPTKFEDIVGQSHIVKILSNVVKSNRLSHAYLFCGPRGTGKTTMARILAKSCFCDNDIPCGDCEDCRLIGAGKHPDVYELDAASRTGVENVREEIINRVNFASTRGDKKVYIIDEVHMLSTAAFNALLKTLEEPPDHVIFILCTTDPQKVIPTIISRCQRFDFKSISVEDIVTRLRYVCDKEGVKADDDVLKHIAQNAQGGMRNALTNLEQLFALLDNNNYLSSELLEQAENNKNSDSRQFLDLIVNRDIKKIMLWIDEYANNGGDFISLSSDLTKFIREEFLSLAKGEKENTNIGIDGLHYCLATMCDMQNALKTSNNPRLIFETFVAKMTYINNDKTVSALCARIENIENSLKHSNLNEDIKHSEYNGDLEVEENNLQSKENQSETNSQIKDSEQTKNIDYIEDKINNEPEFNIENKGQDEKKFNHEFDYKEFRKTLKNKVNKIDESTGYSEESDLSDKVILDKVWNSAYSELKDNYKAYASLLVTANLNYDQENNTINFNLPKSNRFALSMLEKPEVNSIIKECINNAWHKPVNIKFCYEEIKDFGKEFLDKRNKMDDSHKKNEENLKSRHSSNTVNHFNVENMLKDMGATNIIEE